MTINVAPVLPGELINRWPEVEPLLNAALPVNLKRFLAIDILALVIQGQAQAWFVTEGKSLLAVAITEIITYPRRRCFSVFALSGIRMAEWFAQAETMFTEAAVRMGADHFMCMGRKGWERQLDLEPHCIVLVKDIPLTPKGGNAH